jgi:hypothetical protein
MDRVLILIIGGKIPHRVASVSDVLRACDRITVNSHHIVYDRHQLSHQENLRHHINIINFLPRRVLASDNLQKGVYLHEREVAITKKYIHLNSKFATNFLCFDIDKGESSAFAF